MATFKHPITGVELNVIGVERSHINTPEEFETVRILREEGKSQHVIAAMLGINPGRIAEEFRQREVRRETRQSEML